VNSLPEIGPSLAWYVTTAVLPVADISGFVLASEVSIGRGGGTREL
jgi:hypothetical protein